MDRLNNLKEYIRSIRWDDTTRFNKKSNSELESLLKYIEYLYYNPIPIPEKLINAIHDIILYDSDIIAFYNNFIIRQCIINNNSNFTEVYKSKNVSFWQEKINDRTYAHNRMMWKFSSILCEIFILFEKIGFKYDIYHPYFQMKIFAANKFNIYMLIKNNIDNINKIPHEENQTKHIKSIKKMFSKFMEIPHKYLNAYLDECEYRGVISKYCMYMIKLYYKLNTVNKIIFLKVFIKIFGLNSAGICKYHASFNRQIKNYSIDLFIEIFDTFFWLMIDFTIENKLTINIFCKYFISERIYDMTNFKFPFTEKDTIQLTREEKKYLYPIINTEINNNKYRSMYLVSSSYYIFKTLKSTQKGFFSKDIIKEHTKQLTRSILNNNSDLFKSLVTYKIISYLSQLKL